ncbi:hypothetical protein MWU38_09660 [Qipengyuania sp. S6317L1]|uniref:hypothetical protein n=1 Tax=Qipengyuania sp. S6317L1 TaxID=2926410 RepID=UPI001FF2E223|nr:hypothetical protein [Qipengyuania sp. S6317L1]MCK0099648.1 hypothetical protein [Qipengyuania sp. S6317L1]
MDHSRAEPNPETPATRQWESERGSMKPAAPSALPDGVTASTITQYRVGSYTYTSLDDALAEHRRQNKNH